MSDTIRTGIFSGVAICLVAIASLIMWATRPRSDAGFEKVGQPFFESFDPADATTLTVSALDPETDELLQFKVEFDGETWVIPTHYDYPAEAANRLASTTTALMGIKRDALQGRLANEQKKYGVVDPLLSEDATYEEPVNAGQAGTRITIENRSGEILVDMIIGEKISPSAEEPASIDQYYARHPDEQQTYRVKADLQLSTRFRDWINPDLLKVNAADFRTLQIHNYSIADRQMRTRDGQIVVGKAMVPGDTFVFQREGQDTDWKMDGLVAKKESVNTGKIDKIIQVLDEMKIVGVRPKKQLANGQLLIKPDLTVNLEAIRDLAKGASAADMQQMMQTVVQAAAEDLAEQGFYLNNDPKAGPDERLFAQQGKVDATTNNGVKYTVYFGDVFLGDSNAIEFGEGKLERVENTDDNQKTNEGKKDKTAEAGDGSETGKQDNQSEEKSGDKSKRNKSRFVMVRVSFDESALGDVPVQPAPPKPPTKPEGYVPTPDPGKPKAEENKDAQDGKQDPPKPPLSDEKKKKFAQYELDLGKYQQQQAEFGSRMQAYTEQVNDRSARETAGKKLVDELNERFGLWYYIVAADQLGNLRIPRQDLVERVPLPLPEVPDISFEQDPPKKK